MSAVAFALEVVKYSTAACPGRSADNYASLAADQSANDSPCDSTSADIYGLPVASIKVRPLIINPSVILSVPMASLSRRGRCRKCHHYCEHQNEHKCCKKFLHFISPCCFQHYLSRNTHAVKTNLLRLNGLDVNYGFIFQSYYTKGVEIRPYGMANRWISRNKKPRRSLQIIGACA